MSDKSNLGQFVTKRIRTTFIGNLAAVEQSFGNLWGYGKLEADLSSNELRWREVFDEFRKKVLDAGNQHIRAVENELVGYRVMWEGPLDGNAPNKS